MSFLWPNQACTHVDEKFLSLFLYNAYLLAGLPKLGALEPISYYTRPQVAIKGRECHLLSCQEWGVQLHCNQMDLYTISSIQHVFFLLYGFTS